MFVANVIFVISVLSMGRPIFGDGLKVLTLSNPEVTVNNNDYISDCTMDFTDRKNQNTLVTLNITVKKEWPDNAEVKMSSKYHGQAPLDYVTDVCDGLVEEQFGITVPQAGLPKDTFPKECPFIAGQFSVYNYDPPLSNSMPEGDFDGLVTIGEQGRSKPWIALKFSGNLKYSIKRPRGSL